MKNNIKELVKFSFSSILSFVVDYSLYTLFNIVTNNIILSNILARIISATFNYTLNRVFVFKSNNKIKKSALQYFLLAILVLTINTSLLKLFVDVFAINKYLSKILIEIIVFTLSYLVQNKIIFKEGD